MIQSEGEPFLLPAGPVGCLLIHGFASTPREMRWLGEQLHAQGYTALGVRLFGHATEPPQMNRARWKDWIADVESGQALLASLCSSIYAVGLSMGGTLALFAGARLDINGVVAISTPYAIPPSPGLRGLENLLPLARPLSWVLGKIPKPSIQDYQDQQAGQDHLTYPVLPTHALAEVAELTRETRKVLSQITSPTLLIHSTNDRGVPMDNAEAIYNEVGSADKELVLVEHSGHVITLEPARSKMAKAILSFLARSEQASP
jgi:carboxylesterase